MKFTVENARFGQERALYGQRDLLVRNCVFEGEEDGESALKECRNIAVEGSVFRLRYPLWHGADVTFSGSRMEDGARAPVWYTKRGVFEKSAFSCPKLFRECEDLLVRDCKISSPEAGWHCMGMTFENCDIDATYFLLGSENIRLDKVVMTGNYAFQYACGVAAEGCELSTKDMLWHAKGAVFKNCVVRGEYLAWYSEDLLFDHCEIYGTQPFCYCKNLKLVGCTLHGCDRAFEYSDVEADLIGSVDSIKNPRSGHIVLDGVGEIIREAPVYDCNAEIVVRGTENKEKL